MAKASATIDVTALKVAGEPNKYVTFIDTNNGIRVHKAGEVNDNFAQINSSGLQIYRGGQTNAFKIAEFGETSYIGKHDGSQSYMQLDYHSLQLIDKEGTPYFYVSDLRGTNNKAQIVETFPILESSSSPGSPDINTYYVLKNYVAATGDVTNVKINGTTVTNWTASVQVTGMCIKFTSATGIAVGDTVTVTYYSTGELLKAFTFGTRSYPSYTTSPGPYSIAMGKDVLADGVYSFAAGYETEAYGMAAHAEGNQTKAKGFASHTEGDNTEARGFAAHAGGQGTIASADYQTVFGKYNNEDDEAVFIIGNGNSIDDRSNLMVVGDNYVRIGNSEGASKIEMTSESISLISDTEEKAIEIKTSAVEIGKFATIQNISSNMYDNTAYAFSLDLSQIQNEANFKVYLQSYYRFTKTYVKKTELDYKPASTSTRRTYQTYEYTFKKGTNKTVTSSVSLVSQITKGSATSMESGSISSTSYTITIIYNASNSTLTITPPARYSIPDNTGIYNGITYGITSASSNMSIGRVDGYKTQLLPQTLVGGRIYLELNTDDDNDAIINTKLTNLGWTDCIVVDE